MPAAQFDYIAPTTVHEAVAALVKGGRDTRVMAGGTDLIVKIRHRMLFPKCIVNLKRIAGLDAITDDKKNGLTIGATALLADVAAHKGIRRHYPTVAEAAGATANVQVRNMGTVVGNLCNASPSADNAPTLMAMAATVDIAGPTGSRSVLLDQFFQGPGITALKAGEIVTAVRVPPPVAGSGTAYHSLSQRGKLDCSAVGVGTMVVLEGRSLHGCENHRRRLRAGAHAHPGGGKDADRKKDDRHPDSPGGPKGIRRDITHHRRTGQRPLSLEDGLGTDHPRPHRRPENGLA